MREAYLVSSKSKDIRTKIGSVIVKDNSTISHGYNGFPRKVNDDVEERKNAPLKYSYVVHSEANAVFHCARHGISPAGATLYTQAVPCSGCMKAIIQSGIKEVVVHDNFHRAGGLAFFERWEEEMDISGIMAKESGVNIRWFCKELGIKTLLDGKVIEV